MRSYVLFLLLSVFLAVFSTGCGKSGVQAAREGVESADAQLSQANRLWWPTGQLTFGITGSPEVRCIDPVTG